MKFRFPLSKLPQLEVLHFSTLMFTLIELAP